MGREYRTRVFKSGNSVALRLPKALGIKEGSEMVLREVDGKVGVVMIEAAPQKIDISGFAGKLPGFTPAPRQDFEERPSAILRREALSGK